MSGYLRIASFTIACSIAFGAFGAHGLKDALTTYEMGIYEKAVFYHCTNGVGLLFVAQQIQWFRRRALQRIFWIIFAGITIFSGSLYLLALTGQTRLGMITPIGGTLLLVGWICISCIPQTEGATTQNRAVEDNA